MQTYTNVIHPLRNVLIEIEEGEFSESDRAFAQEVLDRTEDALHNPKFDELVIRALTEAVGEALDQIEMPRELYKRAEKAWAAGMQQSRKIC